MYIHPLQSPNEINNFKIPTVEFLLTVALTLPSYSYTPPIIFLNPSFPINFPSNNNNLISQKPEMGGISLHHTSGDCTHPNTHKFFLFTNYLLLGAASSCIFLTLSLRLLPSLIGFLFILLHLITIAGAISGCAAASHSATSSLYGAHMVATVLTAIFQGSVSVLIFTRPSDFLGHLKSYVREEDGVVILKLAGGLCIAMFCFEWVVLTLAFFLNYYAYLERRSGSGNGKVRDEEELKNWPWPFQV